MGLTAVFTEFQNHARHAPRAEGAPPTD